MIIFSEASPHLPPSASLRDITAMTEAAQRLSRQQARRTPPLMPLATPSLSKGLCSRARAGAGRRVSRIIPSIWSGSAPRCSPWMPEAEAVSPFGTCSTCAMLAPVREISPWAASFAFLYSTARFSQVATTWEGDDPLAHLTPDEEQIVHVLVREAAQRIGSPYLTVDIGQDEDSHWWVIETGDAQFSGLSQTPRLVLWNQLVTRSRLNSTH